MCGIVGFIGKKMASNVLLDGLEKLSYRGYDSAGVAVMSDRGLITIRKAKGKLEQLKTLIDQEPVAGNMGIGHTRWATHGKPSQVNAHPHTDAHGSIAIVHNGIIENYIELKTHLEKQGEKMISQTDTEVVAHLLSMFYEGDMLSTLRRIQGMLKGTYALAVLCDKEPEKLFCARCGSPLIAAFKDGEAYLASDIPALMTYSRSVCILQDGETGVLSRTGIQIYQKDGALRHAEPVFIEWVQNSAAKGRYAHYMLKEIYEQPMAVKKTFEHRSNLNDLDWFPLTKEETGSLNKITLVGCGTAFHSAVYGKYVFESLSDLPAEAAIASEYRYYALPVQKNELFIAISQSGETADTLAALQKVQQLGGAALAICNSPSSSISRQVGEKRTIYTYAGPEIAVASTKTYVAQNVVIILIAAIMGFMRGRVPAEKMKTIYRRLHELPGHIEEIFTKEPEIRRLAFRLCRKQHMIFMGRGLDYAVSMEGALKVKEVSYIHTEAFPAGELKHGPIALIVSGQTVLACMTQEKTVDKLLSNLQEVRARGADVVVVCEEKNVGTAEENVNDVLTIPQTDGIFAPMLSVVLFQMLAYYMAVEKECDVDQPRNLAKSVTVE